VINTGSGDTSRRDGFAIRQTALKFRIPYTTTAAGAMAMCRGVAAMRLNPLSVKSIQAYFS